MKHCVEENGFITFFILSFIHPLKNNYVNNEEFVQEYITTIRYRKKIKIKH